MIDVKSGFLPGLCELAVFAPVRGAFYDQLVERSGDMRHDDRLLSPIQALGAKTQQRQQFRKIHQPLSLRPFLRGEPFADILTIQ